MRRTLIALVIATPLAIGSAVAQERPGAGRYEIGVFPVGGVFFTESSSRSEPASGNFTLGTSLTYNINRWFGVEGEFGNAIGFRQQLTWAELAMADTLPRHLYGYSGNLVVNPFIDHVRFAPYATVGAGGMTLVDLDDAETLRLGGNSTYFAANAGGGAKWYANHYWGLRGDYRFLMINDQLDVPGFVGRKSFRYGHRVYGGLLFTY